MNSECVPKLRAGVRLGQPLHDPRDGWLLLFPVLDGAGRPETVFDLLNSTRQVIPFLQRENDDVLLLVRDNIDWVAIDNHVESKLIFPPGRLAGLEQRVELRFVDERKIAATISWGDPATPTRLSDFLGSPDPFVAAEARFGTLLVNKRRLREIRIVETNDDV